MPFRRAPKLYFKPDELYRVPTADGSAIALGRYHPRGPRRFVEPVILGHSLGTNRFNLHFDERYSVAQGLARRGFETWVLELRGHGLAGSSEGATFDTDAEHDVAAALTAVLSTGPRSVSWVGHSRGGLLAYAHLARNPSAPFCAIVTLGSPLTFEVALAVKRFVAMLGSRLRLPTLPLELAGKAWPLGLPPDPVGKYLVRADNMDATVVRQAIAHVAADIPAGVARQFVRWVGANAFDGEDGFDYRAGMKAITVPVLAMAGVKDLLVPPPASHLVKQLVSGPVELVQVGVAEGYSTDYGHGDLVLGLRAPEEVIPRVADFLARHSTPT